MKYFPVSLNLRNRSVTLIGGGEIGLRRISALLDCDARLRVIDPAASDEIRAKAASGELTLLDRAYRYGDLDGADLVMTATDDEEVNASVWKESQDMGIPINVADDPDRCDFIVPAVVERGDLTVAISTNGKSPALAARLRRRISGMLGLEYGRYLDVLDGARARLNAANPGFERKRRAIYRLIDSDLDRLVRESDDAGVERRIADAIREAGEDPQPRESLGKVLIVGAGPGDPELITVRGLECIRSADVVLHDRLIDRRLLDEVSPGAEVIDVGKRPGDQDRTQKIIHASMVGHARQGRIVCRLKGGDPFVFGRGGEEARALIEEDVPFEIVPGVTSATAVPAAAGIPVTHRDAAHAFMVMTGSRANNAAQEEWSGAASLIEGGGTLVVLMALAHLSTIVDRLRASGCPVSTPAAVVSRGTFHDQTVRVGTLEDIRERMGGIVSPAIVVFGNVVLERTKLEELRGGSFGDD